MSFLDQMATLLPRQMQGPNRDKPGDYMPLAPTVGGVSAGSHPVLARLRLQQLRDLARGFGIRINRDAPKYAIVPILEAAEMNGAFNGPPKNPFYAERAKISADMAKDFKALVHPTRWPQVMGKWQGVDSDCDLKPVEDEYVPAHKERGQRSVNEFNELRQEAKALGINSKWKRFDELKQLVAVAKGEMDAGPAPEAA